MFGSDTGAGISEANLDLLVDPAHLDFQCPTIGHRVLRIDDKIDKDLLQLADMTGEQGQIIIAFERCLNQAFVELVSDQCQRLPQGLRNIELLPLAFLGIMAGKTQ